MIYHPASQANAAKCDLRKRMLALRRAIPANERAAASRAIALRALRMIDYSPDPIRAVALYASFGHEVQTHELIDRLLRRRLTVALPYVIHHPRMMEMRVIQSFPHGLIRGDFGILEPEPIRHPEVLGPDAIDLVLAPGVGFDRHGYRLGYGGGYFDRWLSGESRVHTLGLAFAEQIVDNLPLDPWDRPVHGVITEDTILHTGLPWRIPSQAHEPGDSIDL